MPRSCRTTSSARFAGSIAPSSSSSSRRSTCASSDSSRSTPAGRDRRDGAMRIRQHVNPLGLHFEQFRGDAAAARAGAPARGRDRLCRGAVPVRARGAGSVAHVRRPRDPRRARRPRQPARARARCAPVHAVFCQAQLHMDEIFGGAKVDARLRQLPRPVVQAPSPRAPHGRRGARRGIVASLAAGRRAVRADRRVGHRARCDRRVRAAASRTPPASGRSGSRAIRTACARGASRTPRRPG